MSPLIFLIQVSRPIIWPFLPLVYYLGLHAAHAELTAAAIAQMVLLAFPMNLIGCGQSATWEEEGWAIPATNEEFAAAYSDFAPHLLSLIYNIPAGGLFKWGLRDREPLKPWTVGRVTMLGDAAHPMTPFLGQGACMAIEDALLLGRAFAASETIDEALKRYEAAHGELKPGDIVIFQTGHSDKFLRPGPEGDGCFANPLNGKSEGWPAPGPDAVRYLLRAQVDHGLPEQALEVGGVAAVDGLRIRPADHLEHHLRLRAAHADGRLTHLPRDHLQRVLGRVLGRGDGQDHRDVFGGLELHAVDEVLPAVFRGAGEDARVGDQFDAL